MSGWKDWNFVSLLSASARRKMPWRNGGGETAEIAIAPPGASFEKLDFEWRLSSATMREPGPFSDFPGFERLLTLVEGQRLSLTQAGGRRLELRQGEVLSFPGSEQLSAELPTGPVTDLGLIYRPECGRARMSHVELADRPRSFQLNAENVFLLPLKGQIAASVYPGELEFKLSPGDALWVGPLPAERLVMLVPGEGGGQVVAVEIGE